MNAFQLIISDKRTNSILALRKVIAADVKEIGRACSGFGELEITVDPNAIDVLDLEEFKAELKSIVSK